MFHLTDADIQYGLIAGVVVYALFLLERIRSELHAITYNTGRTSENVADVLNLLRSRS